MTEETPQVRFVNQAREVTAAGASPWRTTCNGHIGLYDAMLCHERARRLVNGDDTSPFGLLNQFLIAISPGILRIEMRIAKATTTIEVIEEPSVVLDTTKT